MCKINSSGKGIGLQVYIVVFIISPILGVCKANEGHLCYGPESDETDISYRVLQYLCHYVVACARIS